MTRRNSGGIAVALIMLGAPSAVAGAPVADGCDEQRIITRSGADVSLVGKGVFFIGDDRLRLAGVRFLADEPECRRAGGEISCQREADEALARLLLAPDLACHVVRYPPEHRDYGCKPKVLGNATAAVCYSGGVDIGLDLVSTGSAYADRSVRDGVAQVREPGGAYYAAERRAAASKRGMHEVFDDFPVSSGASDLVDAEEVYD